MTTGERIREKRKAQGLTQMELSEKVCVERSLIAKIELGTAQVSAPLLKAIAGVFGCTMDELCA
ncbi:MAG: helix-turn-helix transcriptional regulator [Oscillospiraceae bacterium]|nr:helix-turn-helix transcriptional regulator [Oscillospiraceae bacterium]